MPLAMELLSGRRRVKHFRESENLPEIIEMIAVVEQWRSTDLVDKLGNPGSDYFFSLGFLTSQATKQVKPEENAEMVVYERSLTKMYLWQVTDWDSFQRIMRHLLR